MTPADQFPQCEAGVHALYERMARIDLTPSWATVHDFDTRIPQGVENLARHTFGDS